MDDFKTDSAVHPVAFLLVAHKPRVCAFSTADAFHRGKTVSPPSNRKRDPLLADSLISRKASENLRPGTAASLVSRCFRDSSFGTIKHAPVVCSMKNEQLRGSGWACGLRAKAPSGFRVSAAPLVTVVLGLRAPFPFRARAKEFLPKGTWCVIHLMRLSALATLATLPRAPRASTTDAARTIKCQPTINAA
jgi:hypothetical protein